ncbi:hypothetical protein LEMLEM_LOCUS21935, partial [Lemmus lemmus]
SIPDSGGRGRGISVSSRPAWSTKRVLGQPRLSQRNLSRKPNQNKSNWLLTEDLGSAASTHSEQFTNTYKSRSRRSHAFFGLLSICMF